MLTPTQAEELDRLMRTWRPFVEAQVAKYALKREDAEDMIGEINAQVALDFPKFDPAKGQFPTFLGSRIWTTAAHEFRRINRPKRMNKLGKDFNLEPFIPYLTEECTDLKQLFFALDCEHIEQCVRPYLSPREHQVFCLRTLYGYSFPEVSEFTGKTLMSVRAMSSEATCKVRKHYAEISKALTSDDPV